MEFSVVILAGGTSQRMGCDKAQLVVDGQTLLTRQLAMTAELEPEELFVSARAGVDYAGNEAQMLVDNYPGCGPLAGIERALQVTRSPLLVVIAVDMPFLRASLVCELMPFCGDGVGVVPSVNGELEPLAAVYPKRAHRLAVDALAQGQYRARDFAAACLNSGLATVFVVPEAKIGAFANWNEPADFHSPG